MKKSPWKIYALFILITEAVGFLSGWLTRDGAKVYSQSIVQPPLSPPAIVFPIVWTVLYVLMGYGASVIDRSPESEVRTKALTVYLVQLGFNFFWSLIFFNGQWYGFAFLWLAALWALVFVMIRRFEKVDATAEKLQWPYLVWLTFAGYLNLGVWILN